MAENNVNNVCEIECVKIESSQTFPKQENAFVNNVSNTSVIEEGITALKDLVNFIGRSYDSNLSVIEDSKGSKSSHVSDLEAKKSVSIVSKISERLDNDNDKEVDSRKLDNKKRYSVYKCDQCDAKCTRKDSLLLHKKIKHDGVRYPCSDCEYSTTDKQSLRIHFKTVHMGIRYPCNYCKFSSKSPASLRRHVKAVHEGISFGCDKCAYETNNRSNLLRHIKSQHSCEMI